MNFYGGISRDQVGFDTQMKRRELDIVRARLDFLVPNIQAAGINFRQAEARMYMRRGSVRRRRRLHIPGAQKKAGDEAAIVHVGIEC